MNPAPPPSPQSADDETWSEDELDGLLASGEDDLRSSLAQILAPPADFASRIGSGAAEGLMNRSIVGTTGELLLVGWQTLRFLVADPLPTPDDEREEGQP